MKRVVFYVLIIFLILVNFYLVDAETVTFDYASATNGQTSTNGQYTWTVPANILNITVGLREPGYYNEIGGCYVQSGFMTENAFGAYRTERVPVTEGQVGLIRISRTDTTFSIGSTTLNCKNNTPETITIPPARSAAQVKQSLDRLCVEAGYAYSLSHTTQCWHAGCEGKGNMKVLWDGTSWVEAQACTGDRCGYLTSVTCRKLDLNGSVFLTYSPVVTPPVIPLAVPTCPLNQTILSLATTSNSHAALWNNSDYQIKLCYDKIFGRNYTGLAPRNCTGTNKILGISGITNAHAENPSLSNYQEPICYGNMVCNLRQQANCNAGENLTLSLSSNTNAHVANDSSYPFKLCCIITNVPTSSITARWEDNSNNPISQTQISTQVSMVLRGLISGTAVSFQVYDNSDNSLIGSALSGTVDGQGTAKVQVNIADNLVNKAIYFKASIVGTNYTSNNLSVTPRISVRANITSPINRGIFFVGVPIFFNQSSIGFNSLTWDLNDSSFTAVNNLTITQVYRTPGQKVITLRATDSSGFTDEDEISILIINGSGIFPYIEKPRHNEQIINHSLMVTYNGSQSYAIKVIKDDSVNPCTYGLICLAGDCPLNTENVPLCIGAGITQIGVLNTENQKGLYGNLNFTWIFTDNGVQTIIPSGPGRSSGFVGFSSTGDKTIRMFLNYTLNGINITDDFVRRFTLFDRRQCNAEGTIWYSVVNGRRAGPGNQTLNSAACAGADGNNGTADDCCPTGWKCNLGVIEGSPGCKLVSVTSPPRCSHYPNRDACESDNLRAASPGGDPLWNFYNCGQTVGGINSLCKCFWTNVGGVDKCALQKTAREVIIVNPENPVQTTCNYVATPVTECSEGFQTVQITASPASAECVSSTEIVPCGRPVIELPFFGAFQFFIGLVIILVIYYIIHKNNKKKR